MHVEACDNLWYTYNNKTYANAGEIPVRIWHFLGKYVRIVIIESGVRRMSRHKRMRRRIKNLLYIRNRANKAGAFWCENQSLPPFAFFEL